ncbi:hypothetical protein DFS34DRAFT_27749 [Phlyctochytrium arcticum]|nr:hypothetical protein DFS34DRAFT_27749 [Phlyctochytrium arcticum]
MTKIMVTSSKRVMQFLLLTNSFHPVLGYIPFNPLTDFSSQYHIHVADAVYQPNPFAALPALPPSMSKAAFLKHPPFTKTSPSFFLSHVHRKNAPPVVAPGHNKNPHIVTEGSHREEDLANRKLRRDFRYTEDDLKDIIRKGHIPDIDELVQMTERRRNPQVSQDHSDDEDDVEYREISQTGLTSTDRSNISGLHYDPDKRDETFLTGVHITGSGNLPAYDSVRSIPQWDENLPEESTSDVSDDGSDIEDDFPLPIGILASIRALRHALVNPTSYWRIKNERYTLPTFASTRKQDARRIPARSQLDQALKATETTTRWRGLDMTGPESPTNKARMLSADVASRVPRMHTPSAIASVHKARQSKRWKPRDEFAEMRDAMERVDERIRIVDQNLSKD